MCFIMKNRIVKIFISSTFREMISERDEIQQIVFTKIRFWARKLGILVLPIDLRWGITEQDIMDGKLAEQCEEAIRFCEPYFIALLGCTYGTDSKKVLGSVDKVYHGKSVTDYEITKGVLEIYNQKALIYNISYSKVREKLFKKLKLNKLKKKIAQQNNIIEINIRERLITTMIGDIKSLLESDFSDEYYHDSMTKDAFFVKSCYYSQYYNNFFSKRYFDHFLGYSFRICFIKNRELDTISTFMYNLAFNNDKSDSTLVFYHDFSVTPYIKSYDGLLKHLIDFISAEIKTYHYSCGNLYEDLCYLVALLNTNKVNFNIFIDSLNLIDRMEADKITNMFSNKLFFNFRIHLSFFDGADFFSMIPQFEVKELSRYLAESFIKYYLHEYKKDNNNELTNEIVHHLLLSSSYDISFLQLLLNEVLMRGCPSNQIINEIDKLTAVKNAEEVYGLIIERLINNMSVQSKNYVIRDICVLLTIVNDYVLYEDFQYILGSMGYKSFEIIEGLELLNSLLSICENQYRFRFTGIANVVNQKYSKIVKKIEKTYFLEYFLNIEPSYHSLTELISYYRRSGEIKKIIDMVLKPETFFLLYHDNMALLYNIINEDMEYSSQKIMELVGMLDLERVCDFEVLSDFVINSGNYRIAYDLLDEISKQERFQPLSLIKKGYLSRERGNYEEAINYLEQFVGLNQSNIEYSIKAYDYLSYCYGKTNKMDRSVVFAEKAIKLRKENLSRFEFDLPVSLNSLAYYYFRLGDYEKALPLYEEACRIRIRYLGTMHPRVANNMNNIGKIYLRRKHFREAESVFSSSLNILLETVGSHHIYTMICKMNLIMCKSILSADFEDMLKETISVKEELCNIMKENDYIAYSNMLIGMLKIQLSETEEGISYLKKSADYYKHNGSSDSYEAELINKVLSNPNRRMEDYFE